MRALNRSRHRRALVLAAFVAAVFAFADTGKPVSIRVDAAAALTSASAAFSDNAAPDTAHEQHSENDAHEAVPDVLLLLLIILVLAKIGGDLFERIGQPAVLGELIFGIVLGNLSLLHLAAMDDFVRSVVRNPQADHFITILADIGVVLLLFEVGMESTVREMISVGLSSLFVALLGIAAPIGLGFATGAIFLPHEPWTVHLFLGAVLAATSVGITARVLRDLGKMQLRESKIILGAAVIDDILGLVVLAVVQGVIVASNTGVPLNLAAISWIVGKAILFFIGAIFIGLFASKHLFRLATALRVHGVLLSLTLGWCFLIAYLGSRMGLAPIVGAFAAGLVLEETTFKDWRGRERPLEDLMRPVIAFLVPVFFVHMGMQVQLATFAQVQILGFAAVLTVAAIIGKQICSLGVMERGLNRLAIGIGMIPRGEVGLIVASIGASLRTAEGHPVISVDTFSTVVIMVVVTTMVTPPILKWALECPRSTASTHAQPPDTEPESAASPD